MAEWTVVGRKGRGQGTRPTAVQSLARTSTTEETSQPASARTSSKTKDAPVQELAKLSVNEAPVTVQRPDRTGKILWVDCEMTGLDLKHDVLIEVAVLVTDEQLHIIDDGIEVVIRTEKALLDGMDQWCTEHHGKSGLTQRCLESKITMAQAEEQIVAYTAKHFPEGSALLAGSSVHVDKSFISKDMPKWRDQMTYRVLDVSTVRELIARWYPKATERPSRGVVAHRALSDIQSSIEDLRWFRKTAFR